MYQPLKHARTMGLDVRGLNYRIHCWGDPAAIPVLLLHGWADTGMSFQFLADRMADDWYLVAPDWRGFGDSQWSLGGYWFPDYLADLEVLLEHFSSDSPARLVGHSMGGNAAWLYAGVRPGRVSHAVDLDTYGLPDTSPELAPERYATWLDQIRSQKGFSVFPEIGSLAERISRIAPRLDRDRAEFLAAYWGRTQEDGSVTIRHDPAHKRVNPVLYRRAEAKACWRKIRAKVLLVLGDTSTFYDRYKNDGYAGELHETIPGFTEVLVENCGHMVHLDQPARLAEILDGFLRL